MNPVHVFPDQASVTGAAGERFVTLAAASCAARGQFNVALSGGSTPLALYERLAREPLASQIDWSRVHLYWGDERCVPPNDPASNFGCAKRALIDHVPLAAGHVHRIRGEIDPARAADEYEQELRRITADSSTAPPALDLVLLGLGDDAHTASLFPGGMAVRERVRWVMADYVQRIGAWRVTLTPVVLNAARNVMFLVIGAGKAQALADVLSGGYQPDRFPAQVVSAAAGHVEWLLDASAAAGLSPPT